MTIRGLTGAAGIAALAIIAGTAWGATRGPSLAAGQYQIVMDDYSFSPNRLTVQPGATVTMTVVNRSSSVPGVPHEIMFGRTPLREPSALGTIQGDGFEEPLLAGATIDVRGGIRVSMVMADTARLTGVDPMSLMPPGMPMTGPAMRPGMDFMAVVEAGGSLTFSFQVPDRPGDWEFGCFQQDGQHYLNGMRGVLTVAP